MSFIEPDQLDLLRQARDRAAKLLDEIRRQRDELRASPPPTLDPASLAEGQTAMDNAFASAERMLDAVESALAMAEDQDADDHDTTNPE